MAPRTGPCSPWASTADLCGSCTALTPNISRALLAASSLLFRLDGSRYSGSCTVTVRPCSQHRIDAIHPVPGDRSLAPSISSTGVIWPGICSCNRSSACGCSSFPEYLFDDYPVTSITSVKIDGVVLPAARYRLDEYQKLVLLDDPSSDISGFPCCQRVDRPDTALDTWSITYVYGTPPPPEGVMAAAELACELAQACNGDECSLSPRVQSLVRQGVSLQMIDPSAFLDNGKTGLYLVDLFLGGPKKGSMSVWSPDDFPTARRLS